MISTMRIIKKIKKLINSNPERKMKRNPPIKIIPITSATTINLAFSTGR